MPGQIDARELGARMRAFGGGSARATLSIIDRALAGRGRPPEYAQEGSAHQGCGVRILRRASAFGIVQMARTLDFEGPEMANLFTADTDRAAAFLFSSACGGGCGPGTGAGDVGAWAEELAEAHASALYHLRSQFWTSAGVPLASGHTMDAVLKAACDPHTTDLFRAHSAKLCERLKNLASRHHLPAPSRVRWGYTSGRLPAGHWTHSHENSEAFLRIAREIVQERCFEPSFDAASKSFAENCVTPHLAFSPDMNVAQQMMERDLREIWDCVQGSADDFVIGAAALRALLCKNVESVCAADKAKGPFEFEVFREGGWFPEGSVRYIASTLALSTVADLDRVRARGGWLADALQVPFAEATADSLDGIQGRIYDMLAGGTFFCPLARKSRRSYAQTVDPMAHVRPPPQRSKSAAFSNKPASPHIEPDDSPGPDQALEYRLYVDSDDESIGDASSVMFIEEGVPGAPPLEFRDVHEDMSPAGGASCFKLDTNLSTWRMFADQDRGSMHITAVQRYLGYRGFGRSSFLVEVYDPDGYLHARDVVAVVSYDRSRLDPQVANAMDAMEGLPAARTREDRSKFAPYITRELSLGPSLVRLATDHACPFPQVVPDPAPPDMRIVAHARASGGYMYSDAAGRIVKVPCEGWGEHATPHVRSVVREFWQRELEVSCPHDMAMRLTQATTWVLFDDGAGHAAALRYKFSPHTILSVWDGRITAAQESRDNIVYVVENDLYDSRYRLAIVAGQMLGSPDIPDATARLIESYWQRRGQTFPHTPTASLAGLSDAGVASEPSLVEVVDHSAASAPAWLRAEADRIFSGGRESRRAQFAIL